MVWSPDNKRLLVSNGTIKLLERTEQGFNEILQWKGNRCAWTSDGKRVVSSVRQMFPYGYTPYLLQITDLSDGNTKPLAPQFVCQSYCVSGDGQFVWAAGNFAADKQRKCILKISLADGSFKEMPGEGDITQVADLPPSK